MTAHDPAVQVAERATTTDVWSRGIARDVVAALREAGELGRPGELAALRAVAEAARNAALAVDSVSDVYHYVRAEVVPAVAALDAAPATTADPPAGVAPPRFCP